MKTSKAYENTFLAHAWGNKNNAGKNYKRSYNKTKGKSE